MSGKLPKSMVELLATPGIQLDRGRVCGGLDAGNRGGRDGKQDQCADQGYGDDKRLRMILTSCERLF
jgi:hypothetical protein